MRLYRRGRVWYVRGVDARGRIWKESTRCADYQAAKLAARQIERRRIHDTDPAAHHAVALREALTMLEAADERAGRSAATRDIHATKGGHLVRLLGAEYDVASVTAEDLADYTDRRLTEGASRHTVHKELGVLRASVRQAGLPWDRRMMPDLGTYYQPRDRWLTVAEFRKLYQALSPQHRDYLVALTYTGLDEGVLFRLRAEHVDVDGERVWAPDTKTESRPRWIPLHPEALEVLARRAQDPPGDSGELFRVWDQSHRDLANACARAEIEAVSTKDLRRTFASWMAQAGVPLKACADLLGHSSTRMVERVYARLGVDVYRQSVDALPGFRGEPHVGRKTGAQGTTGTDGTDDDGA